MASMTLQIDKSTDFAERVALFDASGAAIDLSGGSAIAKIRETLATAGVAVTMTVTVAFSAERDRWEINLAIPAATTATIAITAGVYDVLYTDTLGAKSIVASGGVTVSDIVSR